MKQEVILVLDCGAHGMDIEGQDYRACQNYGPLYKR